MTTTNQNEYSYQAIRNPFARTLFLCAYADGVEALQIQGEAPGAGEDWDDYAPETPESVGEQADEILARFPYGECGLENAAKAWVEATGQDVNRFGHCLALEILGHGVGLSDDLPAGVGLPSECDHDVRAEFHWTDIPELEEAEPRVQALAKHLGHRSVTDAIEELPWGNGEFGADGGEYRVLTDEEADEACEEYIRESVWTFRAEFLSAYTPAGINVEEIESLRGDRCEDANQGLVALIEAGAGMDELIQDAIDADGRGHFLSSYDGEETEESLDNDGETFYIYRTN